jgi:hypothetical protein
VKHMDKLVTTLRLWLPWLEWRDPIKFGWRSGIPCSNEDMHGSRHPLLSLLGTAARPLFGKCHDLNGGNLLR